MKLRSVTHIVAELLYKLPGAHKRRKSGAIITAAGNGSRMGNVAKQLMELAGHPVIYYSLRAFEQSVNVDEIIIVTREEDISAIQDIVGKYGFQKVKHIVTGGSTRDESVKNGFEKIGGNIKYVAIHDAARPLITTEKIDAVFRQAYRYGSACAAGRINDTVKRADSKGFIEKTVPRDGLYGAQTPQIFACDIYRTALSLHLKNKTAVTDDCSMVENAGFKIMLCELGIPNLKLTVPHDCQTIEAILEKRGTENAM
ncbi:MAG: 2-C-methyl-D-erythritol 4-phosphate cytidylyltransferase [Ruminococcaceae bacterium]|nr:2-C-methyl-D-erythritol 4-phosphate cytidylyltransferase [Oscillospiraceae bacterium]